MMRKKNLMQLKTPKETQFHIEAIKEKRTSGAEAVMTEAVSALAHLEKRNEEKSSFQENDEDAFFYGSI